MKENISYTVSHNLCLGCGICSDVCPTDSILITNKNGEYLPSVNVKTCNNSLGCHICTTICPGLGVNLEKIGKSNFGVSNKSKYHPLLGYYHYGYFGYSTNFDIRFHAASGGLVSSVLAYLLDKQIISAAVVVENDLSQPFLNRTVLIHNSSDLYKNRSSKYCPVKFDGIVSKILREDGPVVIVGLPCVLHGYRKYEKLSKAFRQKVFGYFGLYCSGNRTFNMTEYVLSKHKIDITSLKYFQYRDNGCLGDLIAIDDNKKLQIPYQLFFHPLRSIFIPDRCQLCIDHYAELADISFGDIHYGKYKDDKVGINSIVVRNEKFVSLLEDAAKEGYIHIEDLSEEELVKCQASAPKKKGRVGGVLKFRKAIGLKNPEYDVKLTKFVYWKSIAYYLYAKCQMFVGKHRWLWWIIPLISKKGHIS